MSKQATVTLSVLKTSDNKLLLQVQQPDPINRQMQNVITVHETVDELLQALKPKLNRELQ